jgi:tripartite-type tricarboxylate transporter receptor subunit TctC
MSLRRRGALLVACAAVIGVGSIPANAQNGSGFFKDKQIRLVMSTGVAGGYAAYGRLLTQYIGNYLPGNPTSFIVQSMPGGGGIRATNWLYVQAPKDGTVMGLIHSTAPLAPLYGSKGALYDPRNFVWLGSMNSASGLCVAWHDSPIKTWQDMLDKQFIVGSSGAGSQMEVLPTMMNKYLGTKMKIIGGYQNGTDIFLAMERGEVQGRCGLSWTSFKAGYKQWLDEKKVRVFLQVALKKHPDLPDVPLLTDLARNEEEAQMLKFFAARQLIARPFFGPPGVPMDRVAVLRSAFMKTMASPDLLAEAAKGEMEINPVSGENVETLIREIYAMPKDIPKKVEVLLGQ